MNFKRVFVSFLGIAALGFVVTAAVTIKSRIYAQTVTMLHLGCGAGGHDFVF